jgi:hypothetical protein
MLIRIRYASTLAPHTTASEIDSIVEQSAAWNRSVGITGILAVEGESILQVLEGPVEEVDRLFERIASDARHIGVVELDRAPIDTVTFEKWGMIRQTMPLMLMMSE